MAIRSNRHTLVQPAQRRTTLSSASTRCGEVLGLGQHRRATATRPTSAPTSRCACSPHPQPIGGSGSSSQSNWVSSPGGCSMIAASRPRRGLARLAMRPQPPAAKRRGSRSDTTPGSRVPAARRTASTPTGADHRPAGSGSTQRTAPNTSGSRPPAARRPLPPQIRTDRLTVMTQMPGDRRDRPALPAQRMRLHIVLPREHPGPPKIAAMMITATIPEKHSQAAQTRRSTDTRHGEVDLARLGNFS